MERARLTDYLSRRLGEAVQIEELLQSFPGLSRETWIVRGQLGREPNIRPLALVVRVDTPGGPFPPIPLQYEFEVYAHLAKTPVPVARVWWFDAAAEPCEGRALMVRELVEGHTLLVGLNEPSAEAVARRERIAKEHMDKLAMVHRLDWRGYGFGKFMTVPTTKEAAPALELTTWRAIWTQIKTEPFPLVTEALHWFADHLPPRAAAVCLCKGQNGIGEEIWRDDKIVALCDWELANIGDPCQDLALSQGMLKLWDRERIIEYYESVSGIALPRDNIDYYIVWNAFKSMLALNNGLNAFLNGSYRRLARATLGFGKVRFYEQLLSSIIRLDVREAANLVLRGQPSPYLNRKVAGA
jgi:aminoglycoside phosphotransferase (APT) family kinase protein